MTIGNSIILCAFESWDSPSHECSKMIAFMHNLKCRRRQSYCNPVHWWTHLRIVWHNDTCTQCQLAYMSEMTRQPLMYSFSVCVCVCLCLLSNKCIRRVAIETNKYRVRNAHSEKVGRKIRWDREVQVEVRGKRHALRIDALRLHFHTRNSSRVSRHMTIIAQTSTDTNPGRRKNKHKIISHMLTMARGHSRTRDNIAYKHTPCEGLSRIQRIRDNTDTILSSHFVRSIVCLVSLFMPFFFSSPKFSAYWNFRLGGSFLVHTHHTHGNHIPRIECTSDCMTYKLNRWSTFFLYLPSICSNVFIVWHCFHASAHSTWFAVSKLESPISRYPNFE